MEPGPVMPPFWIVAVDSRKKLLSKSIPVSPIVMISPAPVIPFDQSRRPFGSDGASPVWSSACAL